MILLTLSSWLPDIYIELLGFGMLGYGNHSSEAFVFPDLFPSLIDGPVVLDPHDWQSLLYHLDDAIFYFVQKRSEEAWQNF